MRAVIYCRVSTKEQVENLSLPTQRRACEEYCRRHGFQVLDVFIDKGESAKSADRPAFQRLLTYCRQHKGQVDFVVVYNLTRFAREKYVHFAVRTLLQGCGVTLRSATEPIDDSSTGKFIEGVLAATAQFDNDVKAERTIAGMRAALDLGRWTFKAPVGYLNGGRTGSASLVADPARAPLIRRAFEEYATGRYTKRDALRRVTALGLTTHRGAALSPQVFDKLLRNRIYAGWIDVQSLGVSGRGDFTPLVDDGLFQRVQVRLKGRGVVLTPHQRNHPDFPLRRFVACDACGTPLTGSWSRGRSSRYAYYSCRDRSCRRIKVRKERLDAEFVTLLERLQPNADYMRLFKEIVLDVWQARQADVTRLRVDLGRRVAAVRQRLDQLDDAFIYRHAIDQTTYDHQRDTLREERTLAEVELHEATIEDVDVVGIVGFAEHLLTNAARLWRAASLDQRQRLQRVFFPEGLRFDGEAFGTAVTCLAFRDFGELGPTETGRASPTGFEPVS